MTGVQFLAGAMMGFFSPCHRLQTGSGANLASSPVGTGDKAAVARSQPPTSHIVLRLEMPGAILPHPQMSSLRAT